METRSLPSQLFAGVLADPLLAGGAVGVDIFFLISRYILTKKWVRGDYKNYSST